MYKCDICGKQVGPNVPCARVVTATRKKVYRETVLEEFGSREVETGRGIETVAEANACQTCSAKK